MAINREAIVDKVLRTGILPAYSFVPPGTANYGEPAYADFKGMPYGEAVETAKALMADAGYGPDNPLKITLRYNNADDPTRIDRKNVVEGKSVSVRVDLGDPRLIKKINTVMC